MEKGVVDCSSEKQLVFIGQPRWIPDPVWILCRSYPDPYSQNDEQKYLYSPTRIYIP
jgi:hypothetical protein